MIKGTTRTGYKFSIKESALNNYELIEVLSRLDTEPLLIPKVLLLLLGETQRDKLVEHCRTTDGTVPMDKLSEELSDILKVDQVKKS